MITQPHSKLIKFKLRDGWRPNPKKNKKVPIKVIQAIQQGVETKKTQGCSELFIKDASGLLLPKTNSNILTITN